MGMDEPRGEKAEAENEHPKNSVDARTDRAAMIAQPTTIRSSLRDTANLFLALLQVLLQGKTSRGCEYIERNTA